MMGIYSDPAWLACSTVDPDIFSQDEFRVFTLEDPTEHGEVNVPWSKWALRRESDWMLNWNWESIKWGIWLIIKLLYFVWSPPWHLYILLLANLLAFYLTYLLVFYLAFYLAYVLAYYLAFYLAYLLAFYLAYLSGISIWHIYLAFYLAYLSGILSDISIWHSIWHICWHSIWHTFWHSIWHIFWHSIWHIFWHSIWHSIWHICWHYLAVEVQRCPLSSEGPRLRSSAAHWARKVPGWGPAVPTALGTWRLRSSRAHSDRKPAVEVQQCPLRAEVGEEIGDELARRK